MINNTLNKWRGGSRSLFKNLFIGYLALVTGCTMTVQEVGQAPAIEQSQAASYTYQEAPPDNQSASIEQGSDNPYNLPELAGAVPNNEPPSRKGDALSEFVGGLPASEQQAIADPRNNGYQGANEFGTMAMGMLNSAATQNIKQWFTARHATAEVAFNAGSKVGKSGSFDMLMPIFDGEKDLVFTQVGVRRSNTRTEDYRNPELNKTLSLDGWEDIYEDARDLGSLRERYGLVSDDISVQKSFDKLLAVTDALERNYDASTQRVQNAQALRTKLDEVQTPQEKEDLQLRYQQELLELQNQQMRLQQTQMLVAQKERMESKQRAQSFKGHLNGKKS